MSSYGEKWDYTIRIGGASVGGGPVCVFQILDEGGEELFAGTAENVSDAIVEVASVLLQVHDDDD